MTNKNTQGSPGSTTQVVATFASLLITLVGGADPKNLINLGFVGLAQFPLLVLIENERKKIERGCTR
jgi:hypothetical protein